MKIDINIKRDKQNINDILFINSQPVYSVYAPDKFVKRQIDSQLKSNIKNIIIFGVGLGYHIKYLNEKFPHAAVYAFEPLKNIYEIYKNKYLAASAKNRIFSYSSNDELNFLLEKNIEYKNMDGLHILNSYQNIQMFNSVFSDFIHSVRTVIESKHKNFWTILMLSEEWENNIADNFKHLEHSYPVNSLFDKFKKIPALIVCAGPSLDKSINDIKKEQNKFIIICVDTALRTLVKNGITPDIVVTLDAQKTNFKDFQGINYNDFIIVYDITVCPEILDNYSGSKKICSLIGRHLKNSEGEEYLKIEPFFEFLMNDISFPGYLQTGGSVSTVAFDLARNMECDPIVFAGQDLAYCDYKTHSSNSFDIIDYLKNQNKFITVETQVFDFFNERSLFPVKGNYTDVVYTDLTLKHYLNWLSDAALIMPQQVINCTAGGAHIPNVKLKNLSETAASLKKIDKKKLFDFSSKIKINKTKLNNKLTQCQIKFSAMLTEIQRYIELTKSTADLQMFEKKQMDELKNALIEIEMPMLDVYRDKYYMSLKQLDSFNLENENYYKSDMQLFFMIMEDALKKIGTLIEKIIYSN